MLKMAGTCTLAVRIIGVITGVIAIGKPAENVVDVRVLTRASTNEINREYFYVRENVR